MSFFLEDQEALQGALLALWGHLIEIGHPFRTWPDEVKDAVTQAVVKPGPIGPDEVRWARQVSDRLNAERDG